MQKKTHLFRLTVAMLTCILSSLILSIPGLAAEHREAVSAPEPGSASFTISQRDVQAHVRYWTASRMRSAISADVIVSNVTKLAHPLPQRPAGKEGAIAAFIPQSGQQGSANTRGAVQPHASYPFPFTRYQITASYTSWPYRTEGRAFFYDTRTRTNYSCSGTVVNSNNKSVVDTAGHCIISGGSHNNWFANWIFCPAYKDGNCPLGVWSARRYYSDTYWTDYGRFEYDYGAVVMNTNNSGSRIVNVIGGEGSSWNYSRNQGFSALGYPAAYPFNGSRLYECDSNYATSLSLGTGLPMMGIGCDMTGGSSGGPWYRDFSSSSGGHRNGHNDIKLYSQPNAMYSPYYGSDWFNLVFNPAQNA